MNGVSGVYEYSMMGFSMAVLPWDTLTLIPFTNGTLAVLACSMANTALKGLLKMILEYPGLRTGLQTTQQKIQGRHGICSRWK